jgi:hypothetical protein
MIAALWKQFAQRVRVFLGLTKRRRTCHARVSPPRRFGLDGFVANPWRTLSTLTGGKINAASSPPPRLFSSNFNWIY